MSHVVKASRAHHMPLGDPSSYHGANGVRLAPRSQVACIDPAQPKCGDIPQGGPAAWSNSLAKSMAYRNLNWHGGRIEVLEHTANVSRGAGQKAAVFLAFRPTITRPICGKSPH